MKKLGKRLSKAYKALEKEKLYTLKEGIDLLKKNAAAKFDETVEVSMNLNVDPRKAEQNIRGMVSLPHGTGKNIRVAVFAKGEAAEAAKKAGADIVGADDLAEKIQAGDINFDRCVATPDLMPVVGKLGKVLGPKGLMPNPKLGTVTPNPASAVTALKAGQVEYRTEKNGIIHAGTGKLSFKTEEITKNIEALAEAVMKARPQGIKGTYLKRVAISTTMGPGIKLQLDEFNNMG